jgi:hypothetical protein
LGRRALFEKFLSGLKSQDNLKSSYLNYNVVKYSFVNDDLDGGDMVNALGSSGINVVLLEKFFKDFNLNLFDCLNILLVIKVNFLKFFV